MGLTAEIRTGTYSSRPADATTSAGFLIVVLTSLYYAYSHNVVGCHLGFIHTPIYRYR